MLSKVEVLSSKLHVNELRREAGLYESVLMCGRLMPMLTAHSSQCSLIIDDSIESIYDVTQIQGNRNFLG